MKNIVALFVMLFCGFAFTGCTSGSTPVESTDTPRVVEGIFKYNGAVFAPFALKKPHEYSLYSINGVLIGYVDTSKLVVNRFDPYFDKLVVIKGTIRRVDGEAIIRAESLRLRK